MLQFFSHLLFIYMTYQFVIAAIDWSKWLFIREDNQLKIRLLLLFLSIAIGTAVSRFFLELLTIGVSLREFLAP